MPPGAASNGNHNMLQFVRFLGLEVRSSAKEPGNISELRGSRLEFRFFERQVRAVSRGRRRCEAALLGPDRQHRVSAAAVAARGFGGNKRAQAEGFSGPRAAP